MKCDFQKVQDSLWRCSRERCLRELRVAECSEAMPCTAECRADKPSPLDCPHLTILNEQATRLDCGCKSEEGQPAMVGWCDHFEAKVTPASRKTREGHRTCIGCELLVDQPAAPPV